MTIEMITAKMELKELVDVFSNLADVKDAAAQGELFTPDGVLEFQMGFDGEIQNIVGLKLWYRHLLQRSIPARQYITSMDSIRLSLTMT